MKHIFKDAASKPSHFLRAADEARRNMEYSYSRKLLHDGLREHPQSSRLWHALGKSQRANPKWDDDTLKCFAAAYRLDPADARITMDYASFLSKKHQANRAEELYMSLLMEEGENSRLLCAMGHHYQTARKTDLALACFGRAVRLRPDDDISQRRYEEIASLVGRPYSADDDKRFADRVRHITGMLTRQPVAAQPPAAKAGMLSAANADDRPADRGPVWG